MRRLRVLIQSLPTESATKTALRNAMTPEQLRQAADGARPDLAPWTGTEMLLASILDAVRNLTAVSLAAAGGKPTPPDPTPRPGIPPKSTTRKRLTAEQRAALDPRMRVAQEA